MAADRPAFAPGIDRRVQIAHIEEQASATSWNPKSLELAVPHESPQLGPPDLEKGLRFPRGEDARWQGMPTRRGGPLVFVEIPRGSARPRTRCVCHCVCLHRPGTCLRVHVGKLAVVGHARRGEVGATPVRSARPSREHRSALCSGRSEFSARESRSELWSGTWRPISSPSVLAVGGEGAGRPARAAGRSGADHRARARLMDGLRSVAGP
jgi:hypothetical protein